MTNATYTAAPGSVVGFDQVVDGVSSITDGTLSNTQLTTCTITVETDLGTLTAVVTGTGLTYANLPEPTLVGGTITGISLDLEGIHQGDLTTSLLVSDVQNAILAEEGGNPSAIENFFMSFNWTYNGNGTSEEAAENDVIGDDVPFNLTGNDAISLGGGNDVFFAGDGNDTVDGGAGEDELSGGGGDDSLHGGDDADVLSGGAGSDALDGGTGGDDFDDVWYRGEGGAFGVSVDLVAGTATDTFGNTDTLLNIEGIAGTDLSDTLRGNDADNIIRSFRGNDVVDGRGGVDEASYVNDSNLISINVNLAAGTALEQYADGTTTDTLISIERVRGSSGSDTLIGDDGENRFRGMAGNDIINGGDGYDQADYSNDFNRGGNAGVTVNLATGTATDGFGNTDTLTNIEDVRGTRFGDTLTGNTGQNHLRGEDGNDTLDGGGVANADLYDFLDGGAGNDTLTVVGAGEAHGGQGDDRIIGQTSGNVDIDYVEASYYDASVGIVANLTAVSHGGLAGGNSSTGFRVSDGLGGTDLISGLHVINDTDFGDSIYVDSTWTNSFGNWLEVNLGSGDDHVEGTGDGTFRVSYGRAGGGVNVDLATGIATDINPADHFIGTDTLIGVSGVRGSSFDDMITGSNGADQLRGRDGSDHLYGGGGNDTLYGEERSPWSYGGDDVLDGGTGADQMFGGFGNDTYYVDNAGDVVDESTPGASGNDIVMSALAINLSDGVHFKGAIEQATLTGNASVALTGNGLANLLTGNAGNNVINGGLGADLMRGLAGSDTYYIDNVDDVVDELTAGSAGTDWVSSALAINLSDAVHFRGAIEYVLLTGAGNVNITGNALANTLIGNSGNNVINGAAGNDTLVGGAGTDTFLFNTALNPSSNVDLINDFSAPADTIWLENAIFTGLAATGVLAATAFVIGTAAGDANDRIIYNDTNGWLSYDADGNGGGAAVHFATLATHPAITNADFVVV